jgi:hypothetical protein
VKLLTGYWSLYYVIHLKTYFFHCLHKHICIVDSTFLRSVSPITIAGLPLYFNTVYISSKHCCISKKYCSTPFASLLFISRSLSTIVLAISLYSYDRLCCFCIDPINLDRFSFCYSYYLWSKTLHNYVLLAVGFLFSVSNIMHESFGNFRKQYESQSTINQYQQGRQMFLSDLSYMLVAIPVGI